MKDLARVAIVGRPNVGKSTLMNKILGRRKAITDKKAGITRDKKEEKAEWRGFDFLLLDTGGWSRNPEGLEVQVSGAAYAAIEESDSLIFLVDSRLGLAPDDIEMARTLTRLNKKIFLAVNKIDHEKHKIEMWDFLSLGVGQPFPVSALHGGGVADLLDAVIEEIYGVDEVREATKKNRKVQQEESLLEETSSKPTPEGEEAFSVSIVGRPNVGKSTLFNQIVGFKRSIESELPGTTRDPVDTVCETDVGLVRFVDTAGMRRRSRMDERAEYYAMLRALESVDRSDIALLMIDAKQGVTHQDQRLAERIEVAGCPIVILMNKWELCSTEEKEDLAIQIGRKLHFLPNSPVLRISALTGMGILQIMPALAQSIEGYKKRISTRQVNDVVIRAQSMQNPPNGAKILYSTQVETDPPTFALFLNKKIPQTYVRYLEKSIRDGLDFGNTPIKLRIKLRK